tara:strand:+ start:28 stop:1050 length:1023 start_codon:yes stop_codon:yes gene_type:complete
MATFEAQVAGLTSLTIDDSSSPTRAELNQFLTDGAKEVINQLPGHLLPLCASSNTFTSGSAETLVTGKILNVFRSDGDINQPCRKIPAKQKGRVSDPEEMSYATITDPVFFIDNNSLDVLPSGGSCSYSAVAYPVVSYTASAITAFPNEAEHLVVLYGAVKSIQNVLGSRSANSDITTAIGLIKIAVDQAATAAGKFLTADSDSVFGDESTFLTNDSQLARVKNALDNAEKIIDDGANSPTGNAAGDAATYLYTDEDIELLNGAISIANSEINRAQAHLSEWTSIGDMRVKEINAALSEAQGYANEVQSRLAVDNAQYGWYEKQQAKLQSDYEKGLQALG